MTVSAIEVREFREQPTAVIRWRGPLTAIGEAVRERLGRTYEAVTRAGLQPSGPPVVRYLSMAVDATEVEIGWPVADPFTGGGELVASSLPAGPAAVVSYFGPYERVSEAYEAMMAWCAERRREVAGGPWESYLTDPNAEPDPSKWQTDVYQPLKP